VHSELDPGGALYGPICFVLAASCRRLRIEPGEREWIAAIKNVLRLDARVREVAETAALPLGTPAAIFKQQLDEALVNAGVTDRPTILDRHNREVALGLAANWAMRFLIAYALETTEQAPDGVPTAHDLGWLRRTLWEARRAA
jgi:hypothetical protein